MHFRHWSLLLCLSSLVPLVSECGCVARNTLQSPFSHLLVFVFSLFTIPKHTTTIPNQENHQSMCHSSRPSTNKEVLVNAVDREAVKGVEHEIEFEPGTKPICIPVRRFSHKRDGGTHKAGEGTQATANGVLVLCWCPKRMGQRE